MRTPRHYRWRRLAAVAIGFLLLTACSLPGGSGSAGQPTVSSEPPQASDRTAVDSETPVVDVASPTAVVAPTQLIEGGLSEPRTLNPILVADPISEELTKLIFNGLVRIDPTSGEPTPDLAASWTLSDDRLRYTFRLRDNVLWHDGQPFSARDVVFTYRLMMNQQTGSPRYSRLVERIREVSAPNLASVQFTLHHADASFLSTLATFGIVPEHVLMNVLPEELVTDPFGLSSAVGTGPFTLRRWVRGEQIVFGRSERYFREPASVEQYIYRIVATQEELRAGLEQGTIHWGRLDPGAEDGEGYRLLSLPSFELSYVVFQLDPAKSKLFLDPRVRQALMLSLDRAALIRDVWSGRALPANGTIPPASWAYAESEIVFQQNLSEARRLLDEAGWQIGPDGLRAKDGNRLRFVLTTNGENEQRQRTADWLAQSWRAIGVDAATEVEKWSSLSKRITETREFDMLLLGYRAETDPDQAALWSSDSFFDALNVGHYSNAEVDALLEQALRAGDPAERKQQYAAIQNLVMKDLPVLPLVFPELTIGVSDRLHDVEPTAILVRNRANIETWVPAAE